MTLGPGARVLIASPGGPLPATILSNDPADTDIFDYVVDVDSAPCWFGTGVYTSELIPLT